MSDVDFKHLKKLQLTQYVIIVSEKRNIIMKKIIKLLIMTCIMSSYLDAKNKDSLNSNYIFNLTGHNVVLKFHLKYGLNFASSVIQVKIPPLMTSGAPMKTLDLLTARLLPEPINMHKLTSDYVTAKIINTKKVFTNPSLVYNSSQMNKKVKSGKMHTPKYTTLNDYAITIGTNKKGVPKLKFTKLNTIRMIPIPGTKNNSPLNNFSRGKVDKMSSKKRIVANIDDASLTDSSESDMDELLELL